MVVVHLGPVLRRWLAIAAACAVVVGLLRWGLAGQVGPSLSASASGSAALAGEPVIALTVDAPTGALIEPLTAALAAAGLPATIFVSPGYAQAHSGPLATLAGQGDEIELLGEAPGGALKQASTVVTAATGQAPLFVRPAGSTAASQELLAAAGALGLALVAAPPAVSSVGSILAGLKPGAVVDIPVGLSGEVPALAAGLRAKGYQAITIEALTAMTAGAAATSLPTIP